MANGRNRTLRGENRRSAALSRLNSVAIPEYPDSDGFSKSSQTWDLVEGCVMAELREDSNQPYDNVVAMRYSKSLPRTLRGALEYNSEPRALVLKSTVNKKNNLHFDCQVKVLAVGPGTLSRWYWPTADIINIVDLGTWDKILSFPNNFLSCTLTDMPNIVDGKRKGNLDCITDLYNGDKNQEWINADHPNNNSTTCIVLSEKCKGHLHSLAYRPIA
jgi:hypothetical protein